ncbi:MAG TPA: phage portal protein [Methylomirabilota bacterium]|nr:phage portal protein [Methylomirabilota bacterium]
MYWLDRLTHGVAPRWTLRRMQARRAAQIVARHYEAAAAGRRTQGWRWTTGDAAASMGTALGTLRHIARDLERNNGWAKSTLRGLANRVIGWGIMPDTEAMPSTVRARWEAWANTTACDADGRQTFAGLQKLAIKTMARDGEVLVRRRWRTMADVEGGLPLPMQLQLLEPDYLDPLKDGLTTPGGGRIVQGVEFDAIGRRVAYWMLPEHPGSSFVPSRGTASGRIPAAEVLHIFPADRVGQVRGPSSFAPVVLTLKDFDEYEDAALMKQKIAACLAVITSDVDGTSPALGSTTTEDPSIDRLEPGMILNAAPGRSVTVVDPPSVSEHGPFTQTMLRKIAAGMPATSYEDLTGDYSQVNFSSARMGRLRAWDDVEDWRWLVLVPQFCDPIWAWFLQAMAVLEEVPTRARTIEWTAPAAPMIDPEKEGLAYQRNVRIGALTWPEMVRERGYNPTRQLREISEWNKKFDAAGVVLDSDPRTTSQQGQPRDAANPAPVAEPVASNGNGARGHR